MTLSIDYLDRDLSIDCLDRNLYVNDLDRDLSVDYLDPDMPDAVNWYVSERRHKRTVAGDRWPARFFVCVLAIAPSASLLFFFSPFSFPSCSCQLMSYVSFFAW